MPSISQLFTSKDMSLLFRNSSRPYKQRKENWFWKFLSNFCSRLRKREKTFFLFCANETFSLLSKFVEHKTNSAFQRHFWLRMPLSELCIIVVSHVSASYKPRLNLTQIFENKSLSWVDQFNAWHSPWLTDYSGKIIHSGLQPKTMHKPRYCCSNWTKNGNVNIKDSCCISPLLKNLLNILLNSHNQTTRLLAKLLNFDAFA